MRSAKREWRHASLIAGAAVALFQALPALASPADPVTLVFEKDEKILLEGKPSNLPAIDKLFAEREPESGAARRVRIRMALGMSFQPVRQVIDLAVKHKLQFDTIDVVPAEGEKPPEGKGETVSVLLQPNEKDKTTMISVDGQETASLSGLAPALQSEIDPVRAALEQKTAKDPALVVQIVVGGELRKGQLAAAINAALRAKVRSLRFDYR